MLNKFDNMIRRSYTTLFLMIVASLMLFVICKVLCETYMVVQIAIHNVCNHEEKLESKPLEQIE